LLLIAVDADLQRLQIEVVEPHWEDIADAFETFEAWHVPLLERFAPT
jgi:hypothetical protein